MNPLSNVFQIDQNYPTSNFLLVPGPNQSLYTVFIFRYSDWIAGNQKSVYAIAQSGVNTDGTWQGIFDPLTQTYSPITLPETDLDGNPAAPYTVVAISPIATIILSLQVTAPSVVLPSLVAGSGIHITGLWPNQTVTATGGGGSSSFNIVNLNFSSPPYTAIAQDLVLCDTTGGAFLVTLPFSVANSGSSIIIQKISSDSNAITIDPQLGDSINGASSEIIQYQNSSMLVIADGVTTWRIS